MPYSGPDSPAPRIRNHRRSCSFSDEKGPGAFISLGALPKVQRKVAPKKLPSFHFKDDDEDDSPEPEDEDDQQYFSPLSIETRNLTPPRNERALTNGQTTRPKDELTIPATVPFPTSFPLSPSQDNIPPLTTSRRPTLSRGSSHPILLSNGKPLKSSLKSRSPSTPSIPDDARSMHLRVQSAPTTPFLSKNVHFPEKKEDGLESVRVFSLKAKPASLIQEGDDTETETETESSRFPFPRFGANSSGPVRFPHTFEVDYETPGATSTIPVPNPPPYANIHFESIKFVQPEAPSSPLAPTSPHLTGTILVRNIAYEKHVAVRFTLDDWQTTSEVRARHVVSVPVLPWEKTQSRTLGDAVGMLANARNAASTPPTWDRFSFNIRLEHHAYKLHERVLWFVGRYTATGEGGGEWWDNNSGSNYRVGFKVAAAKSREAIGRTISAPEPIAKPATIAEPRRAFGLGFEFPTTVAPPLANGHAPIQTTSPPSNIPTQTRSVPAPSPARAPQRQPKLSLLNYAAPSISPTSPGPRPSRSPLNSPALSAASAPNPFEVSPPPVPKDEHGPKPISPSVMPGMQTIIGGQPATASFSEPRSRGITLQWPWGLRLNSDSPSGSGSSSEPSTPSPPHSPQNSSLLSATPVNSNAGSPQPGSGTSSPKKSPVTDSDQLYNAFVRQWCFAQSPRPSPGHNGFAATDGFSESVLVG
ncbi:carbohydrate-binding module family 21 protein [Piloderma croceum F 1598]|uniref:Carbohydrate-binding module family 21 protein n=1 Tax=Piloderma croceum (strain F 1598) TaxID=765440 RepID=A0A0C3B7M7_PILCF|nr:carbohydrate-binding module family 21 protein [Piloderma croceum F 1598]